jgi:hypothetical protein
MRFYDTPPATTPVAGPFFNSTSILVSGDAYFQASADGAITLNLVIESAAGAGETADFDDITLHDVSASAVTAPYGLQYDGIDDFLQTAAVDFATATSDGLARRNLLTFPSAFDDAVWLRAGLLGFGSGSTANAGTSPDGSTTADLLTEDSSSGRHFTYRTVTGLTVSDTYTQTIYVKASGRTAVTVLLKCSPGVTNSPRYSATFNLSDGTIATTDSVGSPSGASSSIQLLSDGWYRCRVSITTTTASLNVEIGLSNSLTPSYAESLPTYTGNGTSGILVWGAQLEAGSTASAFQNIGTDKMAVVMGARKLTNSTSIVVESSVDWGVNQGSFVLVNSGVAAGDWYFGSRGSGISVAAPTGYSAPITNVVCGTGDISGDRVRIRINGVQISESPSDMGTGNFGNYPLYFGRRGGTSLPYNGLDFGGVCIGKTLTATQLANVEKWVAIRTGVSL